MSALPVVVGTGWTSGLSAYGTVLALGLLGRFRVAEVPELLTRTGILVVAAVMFAIESWWTRSCTWTTSGIPSTRWSAP